MPENQSNQERLREITASIETGIMEMFQSDKYAQYLKVMSRFHNYSVNNQMLIYLQKPNATHVAGFRRWKDQFGRNVLKGEHGIRIIAPAPYKKKIEQEKLDPDTKIPMLDEDGKVIVEEKTVKIPMYRPVTVFDVSQTEGKPLPQLAANLVGDVKNYALFMEALRRSSPVPIEFESMKSNMDGYFSLANQRIALREGMSEVQTVSAAIHEIAHAKLHNKDEIGEQYELIELFEKPALYSNGRIDPRSLPEGLYTYDLRGSDYDPGLPITLEDHVVVNHAASVITAEPIALPERGAISLGEDGLNFTGKSATVKEFYHAVFPEKAKLSHAAEEVQAESISFAVCAYYGIATGENSFGYIATWSKDKTLPELRKSLDTINKTADALITDIDRNYAEIVQEQEAAKDFAERAVDEKPLNEMDILEMVDYFMEQGMTEEQANELANSEWQARKTQDAMAENVHNLQEKPLKQSTDNGNVSDPAISIEARNAYGYTYDGMLPLTKDRAMELFERDVPIYLLYEDNTEAMAFDREEILAYGGIFGIEASDWEALKAQLPTVTANKWQEAFMQNPSDGYCIFQLRDTTANLQFMNMAYLQEHGITPSANNYEAVYSGTLESNTDTEATLESLYSRFNKKHPSDFTGHSLSVSDIVALKRNGVVTSHYVDSVGFVPVSGFVAQENYLLSAEMAIEDDYGMIDGLINNGTKENLNKSPELSSLFAQARNMTQEPKVNDKRESVLAKLRVPTPPHNEKQAQNKCAERDLL